MKPLVEQTGKVSVITVPGEVLDASNAKEFKQDVMKLFEEHTHVVFDMSQVRFVDSSGLGAILSCLRQLNSAGGDLKLCGLTRPVRALFELVRMHRIFEIFNDRDEAVRAYEA